MIHINSVKSAGTLYFTSTYMFGPFSSDGSSPFENTSFRSGFDSLRERPGIFGENHVNHRELHTNLYVDPFHGTFPNPDARVELFERYASGQWDNNGQGCYAFQVAPAFPWTVGYMDSREITFSRKLSPLRREDISLTYEFRNQRVEFGYVNYVVNECTNPKQGIRQVPVIRNGWRSKYNPLPPIPMVEPQKQNFINLVPDLVSAALAGDRTHVDLKDTVQWPFQLKYYVENQATDRDVFLALDAITSANYLFPTDLKSYGDLSKDAIATLDSNSINMFEFLQGLKRPQDLIPKLKNLSKLKTHAGNYLGMQYGILPTISDLQELYSLISHHAVPYFDRNNYRVLTAGHSAARSGPTGHVDCVNRVKIAINPSDPTLFQLSERLRDMGGFPSIDNLWELVPYSFVIDWFINVGDMLESIDTRFRMTTLPIIYATTSSKVTITPGPIKNLTEIGVAGETQIVFYDRSVSTDAPSPPLNFEVSNELPNHWLEAGALIVTARK